jgi:hypothetical protein
MSVIWSGITEEGAVVPVQVTAEGKVVATGTGPQEDYLPITGGQLLGPLTSTSEATFVGSINTSKNIAAAGNASIEGNISAGYGDPSSGCLLSAKGNAEFAGHVEAKSITTTQTGDGYTYIGRKADGTPTFSVTKDGAANFLDTVYSYRKNGNDGSTHTFIGYNSAGVATFAVNGNGVISAANVTFNLDTGGTLDVKERLQNTQAVLLRIKAALIQPDADANTLRERLLEALDILVLDQVVVTMDTDEPQ